mgnify:CR=1 FL=1
MHQRLAEIVIDAEDPVLFEALRETAVSSLAFLEEALRLAAVRALVRITGEYRGFEPGQPARDREAAYRAWIEE